MSYDEIAVYDLPFDGIDKTMLGWVTEVLELRHGAGNDPEGRIVPVDPSEGPQKVNAMLLRVRQRSDRVDELHSKITLARGRIRRAEQQAAFAAEMANAEATRENANKRTRDFVTREERIADATLDSIEQKRHAHLGARLTSVAQDSYEVINQVHWQLDAIRKDLRATLHSLQFESSLER